MRACFHRTATRVNVQSVGRLCDAPPPQYPPAVQPALTSPDPPVFRPSDPRVAFIVASALVVAALTTIPDARGMLLALVFASVWLIVTEGVAKTARVIRGLLPFAVVIVALNALLVPGQPLTLFGLRIASREGFQDGIFFALRLAVMLVATAAFLASSSPESMARGAYDMLRRLSKSAASRAALFVFLSMSFVPLFVDELERIRVAQGFRGGDFSGSMRRRAETVRAWLVPLLVSAVHRSGELAKTVELRGIRERLVYTIESPKLYAADLVLATAALVVLVFASAWS